MGSTVPLQPGSADTGAAGDSPVVRTDGRGSSPDDSVSPEVAAAIDVAVAALDRLGEALGVGPLRTTALVFEDNPVAIARIDHSNDTRAIIGRRTEVVGALLARLRRLATQEESS